MPSPPLPHPGDLVQVTDKAHPWFPAILLLHVVRARHVEGRLQAAADHRHSAVRMRHGQFQVVGAAALLPAELAKDRTESMRTAQAVAREQIAGNSAGQAKE